MKCQDQVERLFAKLLELNSWEMHLRVTVSYSKQNLWGNLSDYCKMCQMMPVSSTVKTFASRKLKTKWCPNKKIKSSVLQQIPLDIFFTSSTELDILCQRAPSTIFMHLVLRSLWLYLVSGSCRKSGLIHLHAVGVGMSCIGFSYRKPFSNVSSVKPTIFIQGLCSLLWVFQVAFEHISALDTDLENTRE